MSSKLFKFIFLMVIPTALILFTFATYKYAQVQQLFADGNLQPVHYDQYQLQKTQYWKNRFDFMEQKYYNEVRRRIIGAKDNTLEVRRGEEKYAIYYQYQVDGDIVQTVTEVTEEGDQTIYKGRYFLVKYPKFVQVVYFDTTNSKSDGGSEKVYEAEVCLELPVEIKENVRYHIDEQSNIWIVTLSMNKVVFVQIYSCLEKRLIKEYRYTLKSEEFINSLYRIVKKSQLCMHIQVITYGLNRVDIELCPENINNPITEVAKHKTNDLVYTQKQAKKWSSYSIISEQTKENQLWIILNNVLRLLNIDYQFKVVTQSEGNAIEDVYEYFDTVSIDEKNNYLVTLSRNKSQTGIVALDKFIINAKTPLFHGNPDYNPYGVLDLFDRQSKGTYNPQYLHRYLVPKINQTKKISYKAAFPTVPNFKVEHIGFGDKALIFWPEQNLDQKDYLAIRTPNGALISQKTEFKGIHEKMPLAADELTQRVDDKPQQVAPGIYEFHAVQQSLISKGTVFQRLHEYGKIELISLMNGKTLFSHNIRVKQGFRYVSSFLLNNEWWILQYNRDKKVSQAKKYEFFFMSSKPDKVYSLQMVYGNLTSQESLNNEDELSALMSKFVDEHKNGYVFVNVYRCVDEYYYIEYSDADFKVYGVARIHFKNLSNRRARKGREYTQTFHKQVMLSEQDLAPSKYSLKPYAIAIDNVDVFKHLKHFFGEKAILDQSWSSFCNSDGENFRRLSKIDKYYYFPIQHYAMGNYGCNFNSDQIQTESILSLNMRNMIIQAKVQNRELLSIQKNVVYVLLSIIPTYFVLIGIVFAVMSRQSENDGACREKKEGGKSAKEKKNN